MSRGLIGSKKPQKRQPGRTGRAKKAKGAANTGLVPLMSLKRPREKPQDGRTRERRGDSMSLDLKGEWRSWWGPGPLPWGARALGTVSKGGDTGALILMEAGLFMQGNDGKVQMLPQTAVSAILQGE